MAENSSSPRLDLLIAFAIAIVSITTAVVTWRASAVSSSASDLNRIGLIDALKREAAAGENIRKLYQEADFAQRYAAYAAELRVLENSADPVAQAEARQLKQLLLPGLAQVSPLATNPAYLKPDGTFNLDKRLADLNAENPDLAQLDPEKSFRRAEQYSSEQRWLTLNIVILVLALFWLTLAQITGKRLRLVTFTVGGLIYLIALIWLAGTELVFFLMRGSL